MTDTVSSKVRLPFLLVLATTLCFVIALTNGTHESAEAAPVVTDAAPAAPAAPAPTCPEGQCFHDVTSSSPFYTTTNNLYLDNIISGYPCGGATEPCDTVNRPYYRPTNNVNRSQMTKFVDNGRRNIADAIGLTLHMTSTQISLVISSTTSDSIDANNASGAEAIQANCTRANQNCWAIYGSVQTGDRPGYFSGGRGVYAASNDDTYPGVDIYATGNNAYAADIKSDNYRSLLVTNSSNYYGLYIDTGTSSYGAYVAGGTTIQGDLLVSGSKTGYVVDIMQSVDAANLQPGDVVTIVGNSAAVLGEIPVITVKKASSAYDTGVVGIVDQAVYVPDAQTRATYLAEQQAQRDALAQRQQAQSQANISGTKFDPGTIPMPLSTINDAQGNIHADATIKEIVTNGYVNVVTLGSYKGVKVDASFGAIHAGDLLVSSPNPGYAMKATDKTQTSGSVIGKAAGDLATGTGVIPVMVTLK